MFRKIEVAKIVSHDSSETIDVSLFSGEIYKDVSLSSLTRLVKVLDNDATLEEKTFINDDNITVIYASI